jgi:hypothetical protein
MGDESEVLSSDSWDWFDSIELGSNCGDVCREFEYFEELGRRLLNVTVKRFNHCLVVVAK